jgi:hypothetical protein
MNAEDFIRQIRENENYWSGLAITPEQAQVLNTFSDDEYAKVAKRLLQEPTAKNEGLQGIEYRRTYAHLVFGVFLLCLRPNKNLYQNLLQGVLGIADPSSIQYGAFALRHIKPVEQVVSDLFEIAKKNQGNGNVLSHIAWLFYWLGFLEEGIYRTGKRMISIEGEWIKLYRENAEPETNFQEIEKVTSSVAEFMKAHYNQ